MSEEEDRQATFEALKLLKELRRLGMNLGEDIDESLRKTIVVSSEEEISNETED